MRAEAIYFEGLELESCLVCQQTDSPIFIHNRRNLDHLLKQGELPHGLHGNSLGLGALAKRKSSLFYHRVATLVTGESASFQFHASQGTALESVIF